MTRKQRTRAMRRKNALSRTAPAAGITASYAWSNWNRSTSEGRILLTGLGETFRNAIRISGEGE